MSDDTAPEAAEYARLDAEIAPTKAHLDALKAKRPDRSDEAAWAAHSKAERAAYEAVVDAREAAQAYLMNHPDVMPVYGAAARWLALGVSTLPVKKDGSKAPDVSSWREYQEHLPAEAQLWHWHHRGDSGLGIVTGRTDREDGLDIEMLEFEGRAVDEGVHKEFLGYVEEAGLTEVWQRVLGGYWDISPSGGIHFVWYTEACGRNTKLASRPSTPEELAVKPEEKIKVLAETRGRGGFVVCAPTPGHFHVSGRGWVGNGLPEGVTIIAAGEREGLLACVRKCNKVPACALHERPERARHETVAGPGRTPAGVPLRTRPGDVYNMRGPSWAEILEPHGWRVDSVGSDNTSYWIRPGKDSGVSASTSNPQFEGDKFYCWSSSTEFEPEVSYSKFGVYTVLEHDGDWSAAAAKLLAAGYVSDEAVCVVPPTAAEGTWAPLRDIPGAPDTASGGRIELTNGEENVLRLRWAIETGRLSDKVFLSSGQLVGVELNTGDEVADAEEKGLVKSRVELTPVTAELFQWYSAESHLCYQLTEKREGEEQREIPALPGVGHVRVAMASRSYRHVPVAMGVTEVPLLKPGGQLLTSQGYDPETGLIYWPKFDVGEIVVSRETVKEAKRFLKEELLRDFPFVAAADRANYLSMLFTPILRHYVRQLLSPLYAITATAAGSGKTYLVDIAKTLFGATVRPWVGDDDELRKAITATLRETNPIIVFDDVDRWDSVGSSTFCKALTQYEWDDRLLGLNKEFHGRNDRLWAITGNNITLAGDVVDRADGLVRLDPRMPEPKNRPVSKFVLGDLREWLKPPANCSLLLRVLVLVLDWSQAGALEKAYPSRFPKWASIMGGLLGYHGFEDFLGNAAAIRDQHSEVKWSLQGLLARWYAAFGSEGQRLRSICNDYSYEWSDVWPMTVPRRGEEPRAYNEGAMRRLLHTERNTFHGPYCMHVERDSHEHVDFYSVDCTDPEIKPGRAGRRAGRPGARLRHGQGPLAVRAERLPGHAPAGDLLG